MTTESDWQSLNAFAPMEITPSGTATLEIVLLRKELAGIESIPAK